MRGLKIKEVQRKLKLSRLDKELSKVEQSREELSIVNMSMVDWSGIELS